MKRYDKEIEHAYIEVGTGDEPIGFRKWSLDEQLEHYRRSLAELKSQIRRHCDSDTPLVVLTTKDVCAFCGQAVTEGDMGLEPWCCDKQVEAWESEK